MVGKVAGFFRDNNNNPLLLVAQTLFRDMVHAAWILELDFSVTGLFMSIQSGRFLPVLAAARTAKGFTAPGQVFNTREMVFVEVQVESTIVVAMKAAAKCSGNVGSIFLMVFFPVVMSRCETVHLNIDVI